MFVSSPRLMRVYSLVNLNSWSIKLLVDLNGVRIVKYTIWAGMGRSRNVGQRPFPAIGGIMGDIVYIDQEDGIKRVVNNAKLYAKLLTQFRDETKIEPIFAALEGGNYEGARGLVHTLKGVTANLSIKELNLRVQELEAQIKANDVKDEAIEAVKTVFAETMARIDGVIDKVIEKNAQ
jgi:HPt (histidine-containing phosphotransfer) domain-containing protein